MSTINLNFFQIFLPALRPAFFYLFSALWIKPCRSSPLKR